MASHCKSGRFLEAIEKVDILIIGMAWPKADLASAKATIANGTKILFFFPDTHFWAEMCRNIIKEMRG